MDTLCRGVAASRPKLLGGVVQLVLLGVVCFASAAPICYTADVGHSYPQHEPGLLRPETHCAHSALAGKSQGHDKFAAQRLSEQC